MSLRRSAGCRRVRRRRIFRRHRPRFKRQTNASNLRGPCHSSHRLPDQYHPTVHCPHDQDHLRSPYFPHHRGVATTHRARFMARRDRLYGLERLAASHPNNRHRWPHILLAPQPHASYRRRCRHYAKNLTTVCLPGGLQVRPSRNLHLGCIDALVPALYHDMYRYNVSLSSTGNTVRTSIYTHVGTTVTLGIARYETPTLARITTGVVPWSRLENTEAIMSALE